VTTTYRKKLIEVALPLEAINREAAREKSIRHGHPSTLHLWWARRPLAACRAVLFGQLVDDPSAWPERFPTEEAQDRERQRLHRLIERMVPWEASRDENILNEARWEIARSVAWSLGEEPPAKTSPRAVLDFLQTKAPPIYDPFCGGGSIPLEAQRLGLRAYGSDLNPVAVLISKSLVEIPPKFAGRPPVNPKSRTELVRGGSWNGKGAQGLAEDVRYYGQWMRDEAFRRIGHLYPSVTLPDGKTATVIAWLWARTVASPNPAARGAHVPLASTFMISTRANNTAWVEIVKDATALDGWHFELHMGSPSSAEYEVAKRGTKLARGANFVCALTGTPITPDYVKAEGTAGRMGARLIAIVAEGRNGRVFVAPPRDKSGLPPLPDIGWEPRLELLRNSRYMTPTVFGFTHVSDLFLKRQLIALSTLCDLVEEVRAVIAKDISNLAPGHEQTAGAQQGAAYEEAVALYLALAVSRQANRSSSLCFWDMEGLNIQQVFARQAYSMTWDFAEGNPFSSSTGNFLGQLEYLTNVIANLPSDVVAANISFGPAQHLNYATPYVFCTDPPYYDNVPYSDISDFFYVWIRRAANRLWPDLFKTALTPKSDELVAFPDRHANQATADQYFMDGMLATMRRIALASMDGYPVSVFYAFKQSEEIENLYYSAGWSTFLQSMIEAGFLIDGTWPVRTELVGNLKKKKNALASSVVLVCRHRQNLSNLTSRTDFVRLLRSELPPALSLLQKGNTAPVDMAQASIGPGMAIFSRHTKILEANDSAMTVRTALQLINSALDDYLSEQETEYEPHTRFAISLFEQFGFEPAPFGQAQVLATARAVGVDRVVQAGLLEARGGTVRLLTRSELPSDWRPENDRTLTIWECTHHLIRTLLDGGGELAAADLLRPLGAKAEPARDLAYRLYGICERKKRAEDAIAYNALVVAWPELQRLAATGTRSAAESLLV